MRMTIIEQLCRRRQKVSDLDISRLLLENGRLNRMPGTGRSDFSHDTVLVYAAQRGDKAIIENLLGSQADTYTADGHGETALSWATAEGHTAVIKRLLGCDSIVVNTQDKNGQTALFHMASKGGPAGGSYSAS